MRERFFRLLVGGLVPCLAACAGGGDVPGDPAASTRRRFASIGRDQPGCTVAVARAGTLLFAEAWGAAQLEPRVPMSPDTIVDIGSTSKQFTATAVAILANRGLVNLDAPVSTYLKDLPSWSNEVTVRHLIHHQSGIADYVERLVASGTQTTSPAGDAEALAVIRAEPKLAFAPGTAWAYSNSNYFLLAELVRVVDGADLGAFLAREVFTPLALDAVMVGGAVLPNKARSYSRAGFAWVSADSPWTQLGDGAIQTTPTQLTRWASEYWAPSIGGAGINEVRFVDAVPTGESLVAGVPLSYGFGIGEMRVDGRRVLTHAGGWAGFVTFFVVAPDEQLVVSGTCAAAESTPSAQTDLAVELLTLWLPGER
jgi:CubicO group peptidase (beta-lactamase class C family)